ncbi:hypothetical protein PQC36_gp052 [Proteus phage Vb_PmiP-P59]|uniref:Uncharacterized protein n=1 Tax=Proteus phage Vb_PmiP-P59 TaxID=2754975 RepID=A0A7G5CG20_9CAUD|nr:hypothetical protein PQC36_gp052 [Proteus phage Vb_PmiP-P59]QMV48222.1 hypothetical protein [Proteus phage Vb_PmiP-P59]
MSIYEELDRIVKTSENMDRDVVPDFVISRLKHLIRMNKIKEGSCPICGIKGLHVCPGAKYYGRGDTKYTKHSPLDISDIIIDNTTFSLDSLRNK